MFFDKTNTKRINDLEQDMLKIRREVEALRLDLELYAKKLKASKGLKSTKETLEESKDFNNPILLPEYGSKNP